MSRKWLGMAMIGVWLSVAVGAAPDPLGKAHDIRKKGKFTEARKQFSELTRQKTLPLATRQEAGYWLAFCSVMMRDPLAAIRDLRWFLEAFGRKDGRFVPDAQYVLGRTYEMIGQPQAAAYYYQQCLRNPVASGTSFFEKSRTGMTRVQEMLAEEKKHGPNKPAFEKEQAGRIDPYSRQNISPQQFARIKQFTDLVSRHEPLESAVKVLTEDDRKVSMVKHLVEMYTQRLKWEADEAEKKKKNLGKD